MRVRGRRWSVAVVVVLGMLAAACSGGGGSGGGGDDLGIGPGETVVQFDGAGKLRMGGTLAMPAAAGSGQVAGVLIVPTIARNDRNGYLDVVPGDPVYQDLSKAVTGAGMAAFRYDRRSTGASKLEPGQQVSFDDMVADARSALSYLSQRSGVDPASLAVVGHDIGGVIAMRLAAADSRVKAVVLLSTPGRPLVDVMADGFATSHGPESAVAFREVIATLTATGALPPRSTIRPEHQPSLPTGQDGVLQAMYSLDPVAEAAAVKVPTLLVTGRQSALVTATDAERLSQALASAEILGAESTATLQRVTAALPQSFDPNDHRAHGGGRPPDTATRDEAAMQSITTFLASKARGSRQ